MPKKVGKGEGIKVKVDSKGQLYWDFKERPRVKANPKKRA
jgi:hypothetical protein